MGLDAFHARLPAGVDAGPHRGRRTSLCWKIDISSLRLTVEHSMARVIGIGFNFRAERLQNIYGVLGIVHGGGDLGRAEAESFSSLRKLGGEIVVPIDLTSSSFGIIRFAHW